MGWEVAIAIAIATAIGAQLERPPVLSISGKGFNELSDSLRPRYDASLSCANFV